MALVVVTSAWGLWCWVLVTEYVVDYSGEEWSVGVFSIISAIGLWAVLLLAAMATWRSLRNGANLLG